MRFPMSSKMIVVCCPQVPQRGSEKRKTADLRKKIKLRLKKVCYKVSLCENCQRQSCKAFIGLTIRAKMIGGRRPLVPEILSQSDRTGAKFEQ